MKGESTMKKLVPVLLIALLLFGLFGSALALEVGDRVEFGTYEQEEGETDPITWRILRIKGGIATLLSENILECRPADSRGVTTWQRTRLFKWLRDTFVKVAFTSKERSYLVEDKYGSRATLPSYDDLIDSAAGFDPDRTVKDDERVAFGTSVAIKHGLWTNKKTTGASSYYLRTRDRFDSSCFWQVRSDGSYGCAGPARDNVGVRPMIYVYVDGLK